MRKEWNSLLQDEMSLSPLNSRKSKDKRIELLLETETLFIK